MKFVSRLLEWFHPPGWYLRGSQRSRTQLCSWALANRGQATAQSSVHPKPSGTASVAGATSALFPASLGHRCCTAQSNFTVRCEISVVFLGLYDAFRYLRRRHVCARKKPLKKSVCGTQIHLIHLIWSITSEFQTECRFRGNDMVSISSACFDPSPSDLLTFRLAPPQLWNKLALASAVTLLEITRRCVETP